ncbi:MAG: phosphoadenosine phosphosulfate reductase family protein [Thermoplasmatales archaeon]|nr:phosphoadenosine phosphosulfate reductase family protein [Thermoplasmatales archaeon]
MARIRLGKNHLRWCYDCNLPILESRECPSCGGKTSEVTVTPPGDLRPAFPFDLDLIRSVADGQFGPGTGDALLPRGNAVVLNKSPSLDRMDEIIVDGVAVASLRFDLNGEWTLVARMQGAMRMGPVATKNCVVAHPNAVRFVEDGMNLMAPGVEDADPGISEGEEVLVVTRDRRAIATGVARMSGPDMVARDKGMAVKTKWTKPEDPVGPGRAWDWDSIAEANSGVIGRRADEAVTFIHRTMEKYGLPTVVSFSGGKDSLATLLLALRAGLKPRVFFVDTGLEFPETVAHVKETAERHGLELVMESVPKEIFFDNLPHFGPPAKDYRWCCKTNKLGPIVRATNSHFPNGVLSLIGQRRYESEARKNKPRVWRNPWTPGQIGASPIQEWNSLHVWLYIFLEKEPFNPWYGMGLDRIGCFLCPASDLAELGLVSRGSPIYGEWDAFLTEYMESRGLPREWKDFALWRWKDAPDSIRQEVSRLTGKDVSELTRQATPPKGGRLRLRVQDGYSPCTIGYSVEAAISRPVDLVRLARFAHAMASLVELGGDGEWLEADFLTVYREGSIVSKATVEDDARSQIRRMWSLIIRSEECAGCGLCETRCEAGALRMENGIVEMHEDNCIRCGDCFGPCPAEKFSDGDMD